MANVCLCKGVSEETIIKAIKEGAITFEAVGEKTGAGTGVCHGARCKQTIERLIEEHKQK
ncbi:(2Fe-2S)-binding protein [Niameybacter massiliensis]|uniref:(2Fe-2S)-binding protein n=1 Tax=Holtiella tumoricola TaxID=3018743 RepID=A0AA42DKZ7_9FIRM|nr:MULTISPECIES: (2Fe-2S)-binding protein [Lachnospirales]MDA3730898.1 (2Fe-2S)-binding protein [Holtiella tumoricola]